MLSGTDQCLLLLGTPGRLQWVSLLLLTLIQTHTAINLLTLPIYMRVPEHRCIAVNNGSVGESELRPVERDSEGRQRYARCLLYIDPLNHNKGTHLCSKGWEYFATDKGFSVISEYDLVCQLSFLRDLSFYLLSGSAMFGTLFGCTFSDHYGRKCTLVLTFALQTASSILLFFVKSFQTFSLAFTIQSFFSGSTSAICYIWLLEILATPFHLIAGCSMAIAWCMAHLIVSVLPAFIQTWRYMQLALATPAVVALSFMWILPKSLHQLMLQGRLAEAAEILASSAEMSNVKLPFGYRLLIQSSANAVHSTRMSPADRHSLSAVFFHRNMRRYFVMHYYIWFISGLALSVKSSSLLAVLEHDIVQNGLVHAAMLLGSVLLSYALAKRLGIIKVATLFLAFGGATFVLAGLLEQGSIYINDGFARTLLPGMCVIYGKTFMWAARALLILDVIKSMPTGSRALGLASCMAAGYIAELMAPSVSTMGGLLPYHFAMAGCGVLVVTAAGLCLLFPDTSHTPLPPTIEIADDNKVLCGSKRSSYSFPMTESRRSLRMYDHEDEHLPTSSTSSQRAFSQTEIKRPINTSPNESQNVYVIRRELYPEEGSVYFQNSCGPAAGRRAISTAFSSMQRRPSPIDQDSDRLTDLEEELNRAWDAQFHEQDHDHDLQYFTPQQRQIRTVFVAPVRETSF